MRPFVLLYNEKFAKLASVAADSLWHFSSSPCIPVDIGACVSQNGFTANRAAWISNNLHRFEEGFCLVDADMVATPLVDSVWKYHDATHYPIFMRHPNNPRPESLMSRIKVKSDSIYRQSVPSIWPREGGWFARAALNMMLSEEIADEPAYNVLTWTFGFTEILPAITIASMNPADFFRGAFYHGEKDPEKARAMFNAIK